MPSVLEPDRRQIAEHERPEDSPVPWPVLSEENVSEDFEIVSANDIPNQDSEELRSMNSTPTFVDAINGCIQQMTPMWMEVPDLGVLSYVGTLFNFNTFPSIDDEEIDKALNELWSKVSSLCGTIISIFYF